MYSEISKTMLTHAQELVYTLKELMPTQYQKDNLEAMLVLFLQVQGHPLPQYSKTKFLSALSRFLNINPWATREMKRNSSQPHTANSFKAFIPILQRTQTLFTGNY